MCRLMTFLHLIVLPSSEEDGVTVHLKRGVRQFCVKLNLLDWGHHRLRSGERHRRTNFTENFGGISVTYTRH